MKKVMYRKRRKFVMRLMEVHCRGKKIQKNKLLLLRVQPVTPFHLIPECSGGSEHLL